MKIAHVADIHISDARIDEFTKMLDQLADSIKQNNPDLIVFAGDMFIHRDKLSQMQVQLTREFFLEKLSGIPVVLIPGNHDASMSEKKIDSLSAIFSYEKDPIVYSQVGSYIDFDNVRIHMFPYPSRNELARLGLSDVVNMRTSNVFDLFKFDETKKNILVCHGMLEGFSYDSGYKASEDAISIGKEMVIPESFWGRFDAVMAGHLHKYQTNVNAIYPGCPFPLTFADSSASGWVLWTDLNPEFIELDQLYPFMTFDIGSLCAYKTGATGEAIRKLENDYDYTGARVRVKYLLNPGQATEVDNAAISRFFKNAINVQVVPRYMEKVGNPTLTFENFQDTSIKDVIENYIDESKLHPTVKEIARKIEDSIEATDLDEKSIHFKLRKLRLSNFKSYTEEMQEVDFDKLNPVVGIFGKNYTGKSSLIDSIIWVLFGTTTRNKDAQSVIRNGEQSTTVELEFESHNVLYKVVRLRSKTGTHLTLYEFNGDKFWVDTSGADVRKTQKQLELLVGTFDMFVSTVYAPQNEIDLLVKKKPSERKQIILDCLQMDVLTKRQERIAALKKETKDKIHNIRGRIDAYSSQLFELRTHKPHELIAQLSPLLTEAKVEQTRLVSHLNSLQLKETDYSQLENETEKINSDLAKIKEKMSAIRATIRTKENEKDRLELALSDSSMVQRGIERLVGYQERVKRYGDEQHRLLGIENQISQTSEKMDAIEREYSGIVEALERTKTSIESQLVKFTSLDCPNGTDCPLEKKIQKQRNDLRIELDQANMSLAEKVNEKMSRINELTTVVESLRLQLLDTFYDGKEHMGAIRAFNDEETKRWHELQSKLASGEQHLNDIMELIAAYKSQMEELDQKRVALISYRSEIATKIGLLMSYKNQIDTTRVDLTIVNDKADTLQRRITQCERDIQDTDELENKVKKESEKLADLDSYLVHCARYNELVGKSGIIFSLVDRSIPIIERFAQSLLADTTNGAINVSINAYKTLSTGDRTDDVAIYISDAKGIRDVLEASGAEMVLVSLALRAAMSNLLSLRTGSHVELFIIDEGMGALDDENIVVVKDMLRRLGGVFNRVLFITHVPELKDVAQSIIYVDSNSLVSTLRIEKKRE